LGAGAGWNEQEFRNLGADFHSRGKRLDESIRLIRALWSGERKFRSRQLKLTFRDVAFEPVPIQKRLPIWVGGTSEVAMKRAMKLGDVWHPGAYSLEEIQRIVKQFKRLPGSGKTPIGMRIGLDMKAKTLTGRFRGEKTLQFCGDMNKNAALLGKLRGMGASYLLLTPDTLGKTPVTDQVLALRRFARRFLSDQNKGVQDSETAI
jgi:hypothetical protein